MVRDTEKHFQLKPREQITSL